MAAFEDWMDGQGLAKSTVTLYRLRSDQFLRWLEGRGATLDALTLRDLIAFRAHLQIERELPDGAHGCRPRTIRNTFNALATYWRFLLETEGLELPSLKSVPLPRKDAPRREIPNTQEVESLFTAAALAGANARSAPWRAYLRTRALCILALAADAGLRRSEIMGLDATDIIRQEDMWAVRVRWGKGGESRTIPLTDRAQHHAEEYLIIRQARMRAHGYTSLSLLLDDKGNRIGDHSMETLMRTLKELAGLSESALGWHGLRHYFATSLLRRSGDWKSVQVLLGHSSPVVTLETYAHTDQARLREVIRDTEHSAALPPARPLPGRFRRAAGRRSKV